MTSKIKIKMGPIEIEYEGSEEFLKKELPALLEAVSDLYNKSAPQQMTTQESVDSGSLGAAAAPTNGTVQGTTSTLAAKLGGSTGPDLAMTAAARLTFVLNRDTFTRKELLDEMKTATAYYKPTYSGNFTATLTRLVKENKLMESAKNTYSLSADSRTAIGAKLA